MNHTHRELLKQFTELVLVPAGTNLKRDAPVLETQSFKTFRDYIGTLGTSINTWLEPAMRAWNIEHDDAAFWTAALVLAAGYLNGILPVTYPYCIVIFEFVMSNEKAKEILAVGNRSAFPELTGQTNPHVVPVRRIYDAIDPNSFFPEN